MDNNNFSKPESQRLQFTSALHRSFQLSPLPKPLLVADPGLEDLNSLLNAIRSDVSIEILLGQSDPITEIGQILSRYRPINELSILCHGKPGLLRFSSGIVTLELLAEQEHRIVDFQRFFTPDARLNIYACSAAEGEEGYKLVSSLADLLHVHVNASDRPLGNSEYGLNWRLDVSTAHEDHIPVLDSSRLAMYRGSLETTALDELSRVGSYSVDPATDGIGMENRNDG